MKGTKMKYLFLVFTFLLSCSSVDDDTTTNPVDPNNGNTTIAIASFDRNYTFLRSDSKIKDRNFYWTTLVEKNASIRNFLINDEDLSAYLEKSKQRLNTISKQSNVTADQYAQALKFSDNEKIIISNAIKKAVENNPKEFIDFSNTHIGKSGAFNQFQEITKVDRLQQLIVEEMLSGINLIIDTYVAGIDPKYPAIDKVSYDVNSSQYKLLLKNLVQTLNSKQYTLFYQPFLDFALGALNLNSRDEAGRFVPLQSGENVKAIQTISSIKWSDFTYSIIAVLGDAPNSAGDLPNISVGGMERCDYAVTLFNNKLAPFIVLSGSNVAPFQSQFHEAIEMKKYIMDTYGIAESNILVDPHARHTTTNMRNVGRLILKYGIPTDKKALLTTIKSQSEYVASTKFVTRCLTEMNHVPMIIYERISDRDIEFTTTIKVLHLDSSDPLDP
jgi:hypothetical protein